MSRFSSSPLRCSLHPEFGRYRSQYYAPRGFPSAYAAPVYVPHVPPVYYLPSPPQYVQDLRTVPWPPGQTAALISR